MLSWEEQRVVQQDWTVSWQGRYFQIAQDHEGLCLAKKKVLVRQLRDGTIQLVWNGQKLRWKELPERPVRVAKPKVPRQSVLVAPARDHPWRGFGMGAGKEFWREAKARGRAARQAARGLRSASASPRPPCIPGLPAKQSVRVETEQKGDIFS